MVHVKRLTSFGAVHGGLKRNPDSRRQLNVSRTGRGWSFSTVYYNVANYRNDVIVRQTEMKTTLQCAKVDDLGH